MWFIQLFIIVGISCYGDQIYCKIYVKNCIIMWALLMSFQLTNDLSRIESLIQGIHFKADLHIVVLILGGRSLYSLVLAQNIGLYWLMLLITDVWIGFVIVFRFLFPVSWVFKFPFKFLNIIRCSTACNLWCWCASNLYTLAVLLFYIVWKI
jgi:hypothetical protein